jgi:hypothetical protein
LVLYRLYIKPSLILILAIANDDILLFSELYAWHAKSSVA